MTVTLWKRPAAISIVTQRRKVQAKLARHIAALTNRGGGYLIFGVPRKPLRKTELDLASRYNTIRCLGRDI